MNKKFVSSLLLITGLFFVLFFSVIVNQIKRMDTSPKIKTASSSESAIERISNAPNFSINGKIQKKETSDTFSKNDEIIIDSNPIYGISIDAKIEFKSAAGIVRVILSAEDKDYLVYEAYPKIASANIQIVENICEETCALDGVSASHLKIEAEDAIIELKSLNIIDQYEKLAEDIKSKGIAAYNKGLKEKQDNYKIDKINEKNLTWLADNTSVSALSYEDKKDLFRGYVTENGTLPNTQGFEYYRGGIFDFETSANDTANMTNSDGEISLLPKKWDWRNRHGENWVTSVKDQERCGSCWAFGAVGATETLVNLYFNQHLDMDLSEQDVLSCSGGGSCHGGDFIEALDYIRDTGVVNERCFPYEALDLPCENKCANPIEKVKISDKTPSFFSSQGESALKKMIIEYGAVSGRINSWNHIMQLVGYGDIKEGDLIYKRYFHPVIATSEVLFHGDPIIGQTYWTFKNSWGADWGEAGYAKVLSKLEEFDHTTAVYGPVETLGSYEIKCTDNDEDGLCNWGISADKPDTCPDTCGEIKDCDDSISFLAGFDDNYNCVVIECNDGIDNDGDGNIDLADGGCDSPADLDENNCGDGVCGGGETSESCSSDCGITECSDGIDNDNDGAADMFDAGCDNSDDNDESNCGDGSCEGEEAKIDCSIDCGIPSSCEDTDSGIYYYTQGTVSGFHDDIAYSYTDYCTGETLTEFYCVDKLHYSSEYDCSSDGGVCVDGACVSQ